MATKKKPIMMECEKCGNYVVQRRSGQKYCDKCSTKRAASTTTKSLGKCYYCDAPAVKGYADIASTQVCSDCSLVCDIQTSVDDAMSSVRSCTDIGRVRRALHHEVRRDGRKTLILALERQIRKLNQAAEMQGGAA